MLSNTNLGITTYHISNCSSYLYMYRTCDCERNIYVAT